MIQVLLFKNQQLLQEVRLKSNYDLIKKKISVLPIWDLEIILNKLFCPDLSIAVHDQNFAFLMFLYFLDTGLEEQ